MEHITEEQINEWASIDNPFLPIGQSKAYEYGFRLGIEKAIELMQPEWVSVKDILPEIDKNVLFYCKREYDDDETVIIGWRQKDYSSVPQFASIHMREDEDLFVTHWSPLPEPPKTD